VIAKVENPKSRRNASALAFAYERKKVSLDLLTPTLLAQTFWLEVVNT
jgi:hypothetical protein